MPTKSFKTIPNQEFIPIAIEIRCDTVDLVVVRNRWPGWPFSTSRDPRSALPADSSRKAALAPNSRRNRRGSNCCDGVTTGKSFPRESISTLQTAVANAGVSSSRRSSNSASATAIDGNGPPRSRAARRRAATNRSSEDHPPQRRRTGQALVRGRGLSDVPCAQISASAGRRTVPGLRRAGGPRVLGRPGRGGLMDGAATGLVYALAGCAVLLVPALYHLRQRIDRLEERLAETED
jgi:hypothetical protein